MIIFHEPDKDLGASSGGIGHQGHPCKAITTGHLDRKDDLCERFHDVCTLYLLKCYLSGSLENECWCDSDGEIGHQG